MLLEHFITPISFTNAWQTSIPSTVPWEAPGLTVERKDWLNKKQTDMATMATPKMEHFTKDRRANFMKQMVADMDLVPGRWRKEGDLLTNERFAPREDLRNASRSEKKGRRTWRSLGRWGGIGTKSTEQYLLNRSHQRCRKAEKIPHSTICDNCKTYIYGVDSSVWNVKWIRINILYTPPFPPNDTNVDRSLCRKS